MKGISPCLWFDDQAEEAANFYVSIFSSLGGSGGGDDTQVMDVAATGKRALRRPEDRRERS